jgi:valyl-tRNA synthetase
LISGYDILFFWDARMIMTGMYLSGVRNGAPPKTDPAETIPFRRLYLHSLVRTPEGAKMSKTKGTGVDPLKLTQENGTDALRYMLASMSAPGTDIVLSEDRILGARAFANKIWNAARFLFVNLDKFEAQGASLNDLAGFDVRANAPYALPGGSGLPHRWIFSRLAAVVAQVNDALENFRFHEAAQAIYQFFWGDFCDWYIEWVKPQLSSADRDIAVPAWRNIFAALDAALRLLHPVMPFLTEELWHRLPQPDGARSIALDRFPEPRANWTDSSAESNVATLQEIIVAARNIRAEMKLDPKRKIAADFSSAQSAIRALAEEQRDLLSRLGTLSELRISAGTLDPAGAMIRSTAHFDLRIAYGEGIDKAAESAKAQKEIERLEKDIDSKRARLADETFRSKAPETVVRNMENTLREREVELEKLKDRLKQLK